MLKRGQFISEIIDLLSQLQLEITPKNKLGLFDLNNYCEDFFKEIINIVENIDLKNLNRSKSNYPALDIGDENAKVAYQITTDKSSNKVNNTLEKISEKDKEKFDEFYVFIIGEKQSQYTIKDKNLEISKEINFDKNKNIIDLNDLYKKIMSLKLDDLKKLYNLIKEDVVKAKTQLRKPSFEGYLQNSFYNHLEKRSYVRPDNVDDLYEFLVYGFPNKGEFWPGIKKYTKPEFYNEMITFYNKLKNLPNITRGFYSVLFQESKSNANESISKINYAKVKRIFDLSNDIINEELDLLHEEKLIYFDDFYSHTSYIEFDSIFGQEYFCYYFDNYLSEKNINLDEVFVDLDFTVFEK